MSSVPVRVRDLIRETTGFVVSTSCAKAGEDASRDRSREF